MIDISEPASPMRGRRPHRPRSSSALARQAPWRQPRNSYRPLDIVSADELEAIHLTSLGLLEDVGMNILSTRARELLKAGGADVEASGARVRFDRALVLDAVASAPSSFVLTSRNPERHVVIGEGHVAFNPVSSAPNCSDLKGGRRAGNFADYCKLLKLTQTFNAFHLSIGYPVEPIDLPVPMRHLEAGLAKLTLTDKIPGTYCHTALRARDSLELLQLAFGCTQEEFRAKPRTIAIINTNSPMQLDQAMVEGLIEMAQANQAVAITPFTLAGAMAPVTLAGALAQQNAEALAAVVVSQLARRGAPVIYGAFTTNVNMRSGAPAFGTPEYGKAALISGQLARRYRLPFRSSGIATSNAPDAQAAYETMMSTWTALMGGANYLHQAAGWLEGGLTASFEKLATDVEILQMFASFFEPTRVDAETLAANVIADVGPGGHFFAHPHTLARYETAFYTPMLSDWSNYETWREHGGLTVTERAATLVEEALGAYEPPPLDPANLEAMKAFIAKRAEEGGAPVN